MPALRQVIATPTHTLKTALRLTSGQTSMSTRGHTRRGWRPVLHTQTTLPTPCLAASAEVSAPCLLLREAPARRRRRPTAGKTLPPTVMTVRTHTSLLPRMIIHQRPALEWVSVVPPTTARPLFNLAQRASTPPRTPPTVAQAAAAMAAIPILDLMVA